MPFHRLLARGTEIQFRPQPENGKLMLMHIPTAVDEHLVVPGLALRLWQTGDEVYLVEALADRDIERFTINIPFPYTPADAKAFVHEIAPAEWDRGGVQFALDRGDGVAVGSLGIRREVRSDGPVGVVGYWVAAPARGRGLAARALRVAAPWAAAELGLTRQELVHDTENLASCKTAVAAGFEVGAVLRGGARHRDGSPRDVERHNWATIGAALS